MNPLHLDDDSFYICTELSPRNFVVQKAIQIDKSQIERMVGDLDKNIHRAQQPNSMIQPAPQLPYWFNDSCRLYLMSCEIPPSQPTTAAPSTAASPVPPQQPIDIKQQLKQQLEYYFSRENLVTDRYLRCQMDPDQFVPISIIAGFRKIVQLTNDYQLILQVLRESKQVEVDERGDKVRPVCRRCTIILREIDENHGAEVEKFLVGGPPYIDMKYGLNNSWYITYDNEETTQKAFLHLQNLDMTFNKKPICARIKAGGPPLDLPPPDRSLAQTPDPLDSIATIPSISDLGTILNQYGYVPLATYKPQSTVIVVEEGEMATGTPPSNGILQILAPNVPPRNVSPIQKVNTGQRHLLTPSSSSLMGNGAYQQNGYNHIENSIQQYPTYLDKRQNNRDSSYRGGGARGSRRGGGNNDRNYHQGGRRNGGANGSNHDSSRRRYDYWNSNLSSNPSGGLLSTSSASSLPVQIPLTVSTADIPTLNGTERHRYNRKESTLDDETASTHSSHKSRRWEADSEPDTEANHEPPQQRKSSHSSSAYSFEERFFPSLSEPKPEPEKPVEKPTFSCVAAGRRYAKPEPKKSYAEKLKEKAAANR